MVLVRCCNENGFVVKAGWRSRYVGEIQNAQTLHAFRWTHPLPLVSSKHELFRPDEYMLLISSLETVFPEGITSYSSNIKSNCFVYFLNRHNHRCLSFLLFFLWHPSSVHFLKSKSCQLKNKRRLIHWWRFLSPVFSPSPSCHLLLWPVNRSSRVRMWVNTKASPDGFFSLIGPACVVLGQSISLTNAGNYKINVSVA